MSPHIKFFIFHISTLKSFLCFSFTQESKKTKTPEVSLSFDNFLCDQLPINVWHSTHPPSLFCLSAKEWQHPLHLRRGCRRKGGANRGRRSSLWRPVAHTPAGQERLDHSTPSRQQLLQGHPACHTGLWWSQCFNLLPRRDTTRTGSAENCSRWVSSPKIKAVTHSQQNELSHSSSAQMDYKYTIVIRRWAILPLSRNSFLITGVLEPLKILCTFLNIVSI